MQSVETTKRRARRAARERQKHKSTLLWGLAVLVVALVVGLIIWFSSDKPAAPLGEMPTKRLFAGDPMPDVAWLGVDGNPVRMSDFAGQPVLINAWATWCPPCKAEMPALQQFYDAYQAQGLVVLAVNSAEEPQAVKDFLSQYNFTFPAAIDETGEVLNRLGVSSLPTTIVVNREGIVRHVYIGQLNDTQLNQEIKAFLELK